MLTDHPVPPIPPILPAFPVLFRCLVMLPQSFLSGFMMIIATQLRSFSMALPALDTRLPSIVTEIRGRLPVLIATIPGILPVFFHERIPLLVAVLTSLDDALPCLCCTTGFPAIVPLSSRFRSQIVLKVIHLTTVI